MDEGLNDQVARKDLLNVYNSCSTPGLPPAGKLQYVLQQIQQVCIGYIFPPSANKYLFVSLPTT